MATETVEVHGHIVDSLILAKVLDAIVAARASELNCRPHMTATIAAVVANKSHGETNQPR